MEHVANPLAKKPSELRTHSETIAFVVMVVGLAEPVASPLQPAN